MKTPTTNFMFIPINNSSNKLSKKESHIEKLQRALEYHWELEDKIQSFESLNSSNELYSIRRAELLEELISAHRDNEKLIKENMEILNPDISPLDAFIGFSIIVGIIFLSLWIFTKVI